MKKILYLLGITTCLVGQVEAGVLEGMLAYDYKQYPNALAEFAPLAERGDPAAAYYMGKMYQNGWGVPKDLIQAENYFAHADAAFYFPASAELGKILLSGTPQRPAETEKGLRLLKKAALAGVGEAAYELGQAYANGVGVPSDWTQAYGFYLISALAGHLKGQYALAKLYMEGKGVPQDYSSAISWMRRSARQGYVLAQIDLAEIYTTNQRLKNPANAYSWYSIIAAYNSDSVGQKAIERRNKLEEELDTEILKEIQKNIRDWKPSPAERSVPPEVLVNTKIPVIVGFNDAQSLQEFLGQEGYLPRDGKLYGITTKMVDEAIAKEDIDPLVELVEKAAKNGQSTVYGYFADLIKMRMNNPEQALEFYQKGAERGDVYAAYQLAKMYCAGEGMAQPDAAQCYAWLSIAAEEKNPALSGLVQNALGIVNSSATPEELEAGEQLLASLKRPEKEKTKSSGLNFF